MVLEEFSLRGKAALVIGGSTAIGRAVAVALAEAGADVAVSSVTRSKGEEVAAHSCANEVWALDRKGFAEVIDAASETDVAALVERTVSELGALDIVVNAHDLPFAKPLPETTPAEWRRVLDVNLTGVYLACRAAAARMLQHGGGRADARPSGRIINVSSVLGERGLANGGAYCAAQAGVLNLTRALALEWARPDGRPYGPSGASARSGINVNAVGAGWTEGMGIIADPDLKRQLERYLPQRRLGRPEEIAGVVVYLASEAAAYLTGQVIWIEGGALSHV